MRTYIAKDKDINRAWYLIDAKDKVLGRLASKVATILMGKNKVVYSPHQDLGDEVIVINASKVKLTGNKASEKTYKRYSAYPAGLNIESYEHVMRKKPEFVIRHAVLGMLPKNKLAQRMIGRLKIYASDAHPHVSQKPKAIELA